ncbi:MAG TPA: MotA/TolQ/ExbB proton channel family protein [Pirellulales bacterium]|jgi:chemotaxis protein MotA|nr:MotA/TolQ/ExbB proton channel family protein [Pirellulales bacterium]
MDLATVVGILGGFVLMVAALFIAGSHGGGHGVSLGQFVDWPALIMVVGGGLCVVMTSVPLKVFLQLPKSVKKLLFNKLENHGELVAELVKLAEFARTNGLLALERNVGEIKNHTLVVALQMAIDGTNPEVIGGVLRKEMESDEAHVHIEKKMFETMGKCGPAFGMIATLLGLILMLGNLDDPDSIGPTMAMALVGTLYGAAMANMICMPCAEKLGFLGHHEKIVKEIILDGVLAIRDGDSPRVVEQKLSSYLAGHPPKKAAA